MYTYVLDCIQLSELSLTIMVLGTSRINSHASSVSSTKNYMQIKTKEEKPLSQIPVRQMTKTGQWTLGLTYVKRCAGKRGRRKAGKTCNNLPSASVWGDRTQASTRSQKLNTLHAEILTNTLKLMPLKVFTVLKVTNRFYLPITFSHPSTLVGYSYNIPVRREYMMILDFSQHANRSELRKHYIQSTDWSHTHNKSRDQ